MSGVFVLIRSAGSAAAAAITPLTRTTFRPLLGTTFTLGDGAAQARVQLAQINDLASAAAGDPNRFSLIFSGKAGKNNPPLPQAVRTVRSPKLGPINLFIVPVDQPAGVQHYQVVINNPH